MQTNPLGKFLLLLLLPTLLSATLVNDRQMEVAARSSYIYREVLENRVKASAEFGVLTLTGSVEDEADRLLAEDTARSIRWVTDVRNQITLQPSHREQSDEWIALRVLARLRLRSQVNADTTRVGVMDGMVTLSGTVRSEGQKELTALIAKEVAGVHHVRNQLVIAPSTPADPAPAEQIDDPSIAAQVITALRAHDATRAAALKVTVTEGTVRITGPADSETQKALVTQLAREAHGVRFVNNLMKDRE